MNKKELGQVSWQFSLRFRMSFLVGIDKVMGPAELLIPKEESRRGYADSMDLQRPS